jgi:hypothetical protein
MGQSVNGRLANVLGMLFLVVITVAAFAALPLMLVTKAGQ